MTDSNSTRTSWHQPLSQSVFVCVSMYQRCTPRIMLCTCTCYMQSAFYLQFGVCIRTNIRCHISPGSDRGFVYGFTGGTVNQVGAFPIDDNDRVFSAFLLAVCMRLYVSCFMALSSLITVVNGLREEKQWA